MSGSRTSALLDLLRCYICTHSPSVDAVQCPACQHHACRRCISQWVESRGTCPHCRARISTSDLIPARVVRELAASLLSSPSPSASASSSSSRNDRGHGSDNADAVEDGDEQGSMSSGNDIEGDDDSGIHGDRDGAVERKGRRGSERHRLGNSEQKKSGWGPLRIAVGECAVHNAPLLYYCSHPCCQRAVCPDCCLFPPFPHNHQQDPQQQQRHVQMGSSSNSGREDAIAGNGTERERKERTENGNRTYIMHLADVVEDARSRVAMSVQGARRSSYRASKMVHAIRSSHAQVVTQHAAQDARAAIRRLVQILESSVADTIGNAQLGLDNRVKGIEKCVREAQDAIQRAKHNMAIQTADKLVGRYGTAIESVAALESARIRLDTETRMLFSRPCHELDDDELGGGAVEEEMELSREHGHEQRDDINDNADDDDHRDDDGGGGSVSSVAVTDADHESNGNQNFAMRSHQEEEDQKIGREGTSEAGLLLRLVALESERNEGLVRELLDEIEPPYAAAVMNVPLHSDPSLYDIQMSRTVHLDANDTERIGEATSPVLFSSVLVVHGAVFRLKVYPVGSSAMSSASISPVPPSSAAASLSPSLDMAVMSVFVEMLEGPEIPAKYQYRVACGGICREFVSVFSPGESWGYNRFVRHSQLVQHSSMNMRKRNDDGGGLAESLSAVLEWSIRPLTWRTAARSLQWQIDCAVHSNDITTSVRLGESRRLSDEAGTAHWTNESGPPEHQLESEIVDCFLSNELAASRIDDENNDDEEDNDDTQDGACSKRNIHRPLT
eukprot:ANDGO_02820.mRNA.1 hypothetical protein isoform 2